MATHAVAHHEAHNVTHSHALDFLVPLGRVAFGAIFLLSSIDHFSSKSAEYAAAQGVPFAHLAVPLAGVMTLLGALSVIIGYKARYGAALLILFLVPVTLMMHNFWTIPDASIAAMQRIMFLKNVSMLGGALLLAYHGAGPMSFDAHAEREGGEGPGSRSEDRWVRL